MKKHISILLFFSIIGSFAQRTYHFDYEIDYYMTNYVDPAKSGSKTLFTNSRDNSYLAEIIKIDSIQSMVSFIDYNAINFRINLDHKDLNATRQNIFCQNIFRYHNPYKYQTENYHFKMLNDTLISGKKCKQFVMQSNSKLRAKRKKIGKLVYIFSPVIFHRPILYFATAYEEWQINKILPQGLLIETHFYNYEGDLEFSEKVVDFKSTTRDFIIPKNCSY